MPSVEAVEYACRRVKDFARVNITRSRNEREEAVEVVLEALGIDDDIRNMFSAWADEFGGDHDGAIWVGLLVGLYVHQFESE